MAKPVDWGDVTALHLVTFLDDTSVWACVHGEWIELIALAGKRVAHISRQIDLISLQEAYLTQGSHNPDELIEF